MRHAVGSELSEFAEEFAHKYETQKQLFADCSEIAARVAALVESGQAACGDEIELPDGRVFTIVDNFAGGNVQWRPAPIRRIDLEVLKPPKKPK